MKTALTIETLREALNRVPREYDNMEVWITDPQEGYMWGAVYGLTVPAITSDFQNVLLLDTVSDLWENGGKEPEPSDPRPSILEIRDTEYFAEMAKAAKNLQSKIVSKSQDIDSDITKVVDEHFWDLMDAPGDKIPSIDENGTIRHACFCDMKGKGDQHEYEKGCSGWNECFYCDNGFYTCNQNCLVFGR